MANLDRANGFTIESPEKYTPNRYLLVDATTLADGEVVYMSSAGLAQATRVDGYILGVAAGTMRNGITNEVVSVSDTASSSRGDYIMVYDDAYAIFVGQITTYAATAPYATATAAAMYDFILTTTIQEVNAAAHTKDEVQVLGLAADPVTGDLSVATTNAKVRFRMNPANHVFGIGK